MPMQKVCPSLLRAGAFGPQILAFRHPRAGCQIIKGTVGRGEPVAQAARRELHEESGILLAGPMRPLGVARIRRGKPADRPIWHLFAATTRGLPDRWAHQCEDDGGLTFRFFWHPLGLPLRPAHCAFNDAILAARAALAGKPPPRLYAHFSPNKALAAKSETPNAAANQRFQRVG